MTANKEWDYMCGKQMSIGDLTVAHFYLSPMYESVKHHVNDVFNKAKRVYSAVQKLES